MTRQKIETTGPRAHLAKAIESTRDAEAHLQALHASVTRINEQLYTARAQLERAREQDEDAKSERVRAIVAGDDDMAVLERPAHSAVAGVERTISACQEARRLVGQELAEAERNIGFKALCVRSAVGDVLAAEALDRQIAEVERLRGEHERARAVLKFMRGVAPQSCDEKIAAALVPAEQLGPSSTAVAAWRAAFDALSRDASAPLPR